MASRTHVNFRPAHLRSSGGAEHRAIHADCGGGALASLCRYRPDASQPLHSHDYVTVSILLAGTLLEHVERSEFELGQPALGFKPRGCGHDDRWSGDGGLMFTLKLEGEAAEALERAHAPGWTRLAVPGLVELVRLALFASSAPLRDEAAEDLLALLQTRGAPLAGEAPLWLEAARARIEEEPDSIRIAEAAQAGGVHRAHLAKMFQRHFGMPPSVYRRRVLASRALTALAQSDEPIGTIAAELGYSDQAHMTRCVGAHAGLAPAAFRALLGDKGDIRSR